MSNVTTYSWDTVFATTYAEINSQIAAQWSTLTTEAPLLASISNSTPNKKASVTLTTAAWQLTPGGDGNIVQLKLPILNGTYEGYNNNYDLSGSDIVISLTLKWVPQPGQTQFAISDNETAVEADLNANTTVTTNIIQAFQARGVPLSPTATITAITTGISWQVVDASSGTSYYLYLTNVKNDDDLIEVYEYNTHTLHVDTDSAITPVTVVSAGTISDPNKVDGPLLLELINEKIDENLGVFTFVFASVDVVSQMGSPGQGSSNVGANDVWSWLQPTTVEYAVVELDDNPTVDNCVFAVLSMVGGNINSKPVSQVDSNAIPTGCTGGLLISPTMFINNMLLPSISAAFPGSSTTDFASNNNNLSISNQNTVVWANVQPDENDPATVTLSAAPDGFTMAIENNRVTMSFTNLSYPIVKLGTTWGKVDVVFTGQFTLTLETGSNGNKTLWFDVPSDQLEVTSVSVAMTEKFYTAEEVVGIFTVALSALGIAGGLGSKLATKAAGSAITEAGMVTAEATAADIKAAFTTLLEDPAGKAQFLANAAEGADAMLNNATILLKSANVFTTVAKISGVLAALTGMATGGLMITEAVLSKAAKNEWEDTPAFSNFADLAISRYSFGNLKTWNVQSAGLAESLQIGFTAA